MAEIEIYDVIGDGTAKEVKAQLGKLRADEPLTVSINSPGGYLHDGLAVYNMLGRHQGEVTTRVDGAAFSAASILMLAGTKREMASNALVLIHDPWTGPVPGEIAELRRALEYLNKTRRQAAKIYTDRTTLDKQAVDAEMARESVYDAEEALNYGFATEIIDAAPVEMCVQLDRLPVHQELREELAEMIKQRVVPLSQLEARDVIQKARERATSILGE